ncbi:MAG: recombinase family protein, partial [Actinomycetota bacterium]
MRHAGVYARISSDPEGTRLGVARQVEDRRKRAEQLGWTVVDEYIDNDVSAWSGKPRPEYRRLLDDLKNRVIDAVIVWQLDRLQRHPRHLEDLITLVEDLGDVSVETVTAGLVDLATPAGRTVARILGAVDRQESDNKSLRLR